ncbi:MAG: M20/M25/M40 family metallo-hydrolase, partial [Gemmatimonadaceae bacterium]|nr:M20/M25/M40 family metallo-hydrolase [Gemmatimonadaceae bacterium]
MRDAWANGRGPFTAEEAQRLVELRRDIHRHPELSWQEEGTARRLEEALRSAGLTEMRRVAGTGLVARVPGADPGAPVTAIRGDIDALPIQEATGLPYESAVPGVMHACGHDVHALDHEGLYRLRRQVGMMFQKGGLFSDLTVFENIAFPMRE